LSEEKPSKSRRKREAHALQALGESLTRQSPANLDRLPLDPVLRDAVDEYGRLSKRLAQRRQLQFIGRLMRDADAEAIADALAALEGGSLAQKQRDNLVERWQSRLVEEGDVAVGELVATFPEVDRQVLRSLVRQCAKEPADPQAAKALRRFLAELVE
jgi:ribosome-associated protein